MHNSHGTVGEDGYSREYKWCWEYTGNCAGIGRPGNQHLAVECELLGWRATDSSPDAHEQCARFAIRLQAAKNCPLSATAHVVQVGRSQTNPRDGPRRANQTEKSPRVSSAVVNCESGWCPLDRLGQRWGVEGLESVGGQTSLENDRMESVIWSPAPRCAGFVRMWSTIHGRGSSLPQPSSLAFQRV